MVGNWVKTRAVKLFVLLPVLPLAILLIGCGDGEDTALIPTPASESQLQPEATIALPPTPVRAYDRYDFQFVEAFGGHVWDRAVDIAFLPDGESALVADQVGQVFQAFLGRSA